MDETLRYPHDPRIVGAGDAVVTPDGVGAHLRMSCAAALPLGGHAAQTVLHLIRGEEPAPISIGFLLQCLSLGRKDGHIQLVRPDDSARAGRLTGRSAAWVKERICRLVVDGPTKERHRPGAYRSVKGPRRSATAPHPEPRCHAATPPDPEHRPTRAGPTARDPHRGTVDAGVAPPRLPGHPTRRPLKLTRAVARRLLAYTVPDAAGPPAYGSFPTSADLTTHRTGRRRCGAAPPAPVAGDRITRCPLRAVSLRGGWEEVRVGTAFRGSGERVAGEGGCGSVGGAG